MSHNAGILAHYESRSARPTTFVPVDVADEMVRRMAAERISRRVVRLIAPDSLLTAEQFTDAGESVLARAFRLAGIQHFISRRRPVFPSEEDLSFAPVAELPGVRFILPREKAIAWAMARRDAAIACCSEYQWG